MVTITLIGQLHNRGITLREYSCLSYSSTKTLTLSTEAYTYLMDITKNTSSEGIFLLPSDIGLTLNGFY